MSFDDERAVAYRCQSDCQVTLITSNLSGKWLPNHFRFRITQDSLKFSVARANANNSLSPSWF